MSALTEETAQPSSTFLQPRAILVLQVSQTIPLMAVSFSIPTSISITPPLPAKLVVASQILDLRPAAPSASINPVSQDDTMNAPPGEESCEATT